MKCHSCGYGLHIEDEKCPHCGMENPYYKKHRADMGRYEKDYSEVKQHVYKKTGFFTGMTVKITIIAVLVALEMGALVFHHYSWDVRRAINKSDAKRNMDIYTEELDRLEQEGDFKRFAIFYELKNLGSVDEYEEYWKVYRMSSAYQYVYDDFVRLLCDDDYMDKDERIQNLCDNLEYMYEVAERNEYDEEEWYSEAHVQAMERMKEDVKAMLVAYGGLSKEEADNFENLSNARKQLALEGGLGLDEN